METRRNKIVMAAAVQHGTLNVTKIYIQMKRLGLHAWDVGIHWPNAKYVTQIARCTHERKCFADRQCPCWAPAAFWCRIGHFCCCNSTNINEKDCLAFFADAPQRQRYILIWNDFKICDTHTTYIQMCPRDAKCWRAMSSELTVNFFSRVSTSRNGPQTINFDFSFILIAHHSSTHAIDCEWVYDGRHSNALGTVKNSIKPNA